MSPPAPNLRPFQPRLCALAERLHSVDVRVFERAIAAVLFEQLHPVTSELVRDSADLASELVASTGSHDGPGFDEGSPFRRFELEVDARLGSSARTAVVADIAVVVELELRQRLARLSRMTARMAALPLLAECDGGLRAVRKGLAAIDHVIAEQCGSPGCLQLLTERQEALEVRAAYVRLRRALGEQAPGADATSLVTRLRSVGASIALLVGREIYPALRLGDRLRLRELERAILGWLRSSGRDPDAGTRIWEDLVAFVGGLGQLNRRAALADHDRDAIAAALRQLGDSEQGATGPLRDQLAALLGRDPELDGLLAEAEPGVPARWRSVLERLARELGGPVRERPPEQAP